MDRIYFPLTVSRNLTEGVRAIRSASVKDEAARETLGRLLQSALQLEFATIPTYLSAAFSLTANTQISQLILRTAIEEMLHMPAVANLMNAIGTAPNIQAAAPQYPYYLRVLEPPLRLDLHSFSMDLVKDLFMRIEVPEEPVVFEVVAAPRPRTIGQFYAAIIDIIERDTIPDLFRNAVRDAYKQRTVVPNFRPIAYLNNADTDTYPLKPEINFMITDKTSAVRHLSWVVDQGEGAEPFDPLTAEGIPGHYYRFESIVRSRFLVKDERTEKGYSFSGGDLAFDPAGVHEFDANVKVKDFAAFQRVERQMKSFNESYTDTINFLHEAFNCPTTQQAQEAEAVYQQALGNMRNMQNIATAIIRQAKASGIKAGIPFEYTGPPTT